LLRSKRAEMQQLVIAIGTDKPENASQLQAIKISKMGELQKEHMRLQGELRKAAVRLAAQQARAKSLDTIEVSDTDLDNYIGKDPLLQTHLNRVERLQARVKYLGEVFVHPEREPSFVRARSDLKAAEELLASRRAKMQKE